MPNIMPNIPIENKYILSQAPAPVGPGPEEEEEERWLVHPGGPGFSSFRLAESALPGWITRSQLVRLTAAGYATEIRRMPSGLRLVFSDSELVAEQARLNWEAEQARLSD